MYQAQQSYNLILEDSQEANREMLAHKELQKYPQITGYLFPPLATVGDFVWSDA